MIMSRATSRSATRSARRAGHRDAVRAGAVLALVAVIVLLAVDNRQQISVGWLVGDADMALYQLFVGTFALGIVVGFIARGRRRDPE